MADTNQSIAQSADALASFSEPVQGAILPIASGTFAGAGAYDLDQMMSRFATPIDLQSVAPPSAWTDLPRVLRDLFASMSVSELVASALRGDEFRTLINSPAVFAEAAAVSYADYIEIQFRDWLELLVGVGNFAKDAVGCGCTLLALDAEAISEMLFGSGNAQELEDAIEAIELTIALKPECEPLRTTLRALEALRAAFLWFKEKLSNLSQLWNEVGELALMLAEVLRDAKIQEAIIAIRNDAEKLGKVYGTLIGVVIWEIIEAVATAGLGKGVKLVRVAL